jgi:hypothetical protein
LPCFLCRSPDIHLITIISSLHSLSLLPNSLTP